MNNIRRKNLDQAAAMIAEARAMIDACREEEEEAYENLPEGIQESERGQTMQDYIDSMDAIISDLETLEETIEEIISG